MQTVKGHFFAQKWAAQERTTNLQKIHFFVLDSSIFYKETMINYFTGIAALWGGENMRRGEKLDG